MIVVISRLHLIVMIISKGRCSCLFSHGFVIAMVVKNYNPMLQLHLCLQVTGIIRRVWDKWALVDIGCDRLARVHAREHPRERNECPALVNYDAVRLSF